MTTHSSASHAETAALARRYLALTTNESGERLANIYETEAFKTLYDPNGASERKLRLPRRMLQVHNQYDVNTHLFQKLYYHPGLLLDDEEMLSSIFFSQSAAHDKLEAASRAVMIAGIFPITYYMSRSVRPYGCGIFAVGYAASYFLAVKPFLRQQFQKSLNKAAVPFKTKYSIKDDVDYMPTEK